MAAKDEKTWAEAIEAVSGQGSTYNLSALKSVLLENATRKRAYRNTDRVKK